MLHDDQQRRSALRSKNESLERRITIRDMKLDELRANALGIIVQFMFPADTSWKKRKMG